MLTESSSGMTKVVTSLKVAALVSILGAVVLAAEHELAVPPEQTAASAITAPRDGSANSGAQPAASDYFPAQFPAPSGAVADQPQTF
jgi:hypothetical protein